VKEALENLPYQFRLVVLLCDVEGFSYNEIANIIDAPLGTVMSRLYRGRKLLQRYLWGYAKKRGYVLDDTNRRK
jgi:RNA polymerase sigma-70 factor (ECF subfamily)